MFQRFLAFGSGNILAAIIPFLLLPFLTRNLVPQVMGEIAFIESMIMLVSPLIIFGIDGAYSAFYYKLSPSERRAVSVSLLQLSLASSLVLFPIIMLVAYFNLLPVTVSNIWVYLLAVLFYSQAICSLMFSQFLMSGEAIFYALLKVSIGLICALVTLFAIDRLNMGGEGRLIGIYSGPIIGSVVCLVVMARRKVFDALSFRADLVVKSFRFGIGIVVHSWSAIIFFASDRIILGYMVSAEELGKYAVATQVGMIMAVIQNTFSQVWSPHCFRLLTNQKIAILNEQSKISIVSLFFVSLAVAAIVPYIYSIFIDPQYYEMIFISYWVIFIYFFLGVYKVYVAKLFFYEKTGLLAKITAFCAALNVALTVYLVLQVGVVGAVIATFYSSISFAILVYHQAQSCSLNEFQRVDL